MLHAPIIAAPPHAVLPPLTAGAYLKLRREAAGLSISHVASIIAPKPARFAKALSLVQTLEGDGARARHVDTLIALRKAFPFDILVYRQLAEEPAERHPTVCRGCGCSEWDPCRALYSADCCGWSSTVSCTRCTERQS